MVDSFTLGIEEEFMIIDPESRDLVSRMSQLLAQGTQKQGVELQEELHESVVEVATGICANIEDARAQVTQNRLEAARVAEKTGSKIGAASTHPFARWQDQKITNKERYARLVNDLQDVARANLIFGFHVHVGIPDRDEAIAIYNMARYFLPHLLALSTSSPFFDGRDTGLKSVRTLIFGRLPRTGISERFANYREFEEFVNLLVKTGCIDDGSAIWWDLRPHPRFSTLEFRICDIPTRLDDGIAIAALIQALVAKLTWLHRRNQSWAVHRSALMNENKWRAARYGVSGRLIDFGRRAQVSFAELAEELVDLVDDVVDDLGSRKEIERVKLIASEGTSADRQIRVFEETRSLEAVVDHIIEETMEGLQDHSDPP